MKVLLAPILGLLFFIFLSIIDMNNKMSNMEHQMTQVKNSNEKMNEHYGEIVQTLQDIQSSIVGLELEVELAMAKNGTDEERKALIQKILLRTIAQVETSLEHSTMNSMGQSSNAIEMPKAEIEENMFIPLSIYEIELAKNEDNKETITSEEMEEASINVNKKLMELYNGRNKNANKEYERKTIEWLEKE